MSNYERGKIRNRRYAQQIRDFSGLRFGTITPTDIDAFIDFQDKTFVYIEIKHGTAPLPQGQRLALERLCDSSQKAGKHSLVIIATHDTEHDIDVGGSYVTEYRYKGQWVHYFKKITVREAIDKFIKNNVAV